MTSFKLLTGRENLNLVSYKHFLIDSKTLESFLLLKEAAREAGFELEIISAFRSFERQQKIWNDKASGKRVLLDKNERPLDFNTANPEEILQAIMYFSAIPGASRHHWGTDIDIYDAKKKEAKDVELTQSECTNGGAFCELHNWLDEMILKNKSFGFFRPYDEDLGGVAPEKWHLSYSPLSQNYLEEYSLELFQKNLELSDISFKEVLLSRLDELYFQYIKNIAQIPF